MTLPVMGREPPPALAGDRDSQGLWDPRGTPGQGCASLGTRPLVPLLLPPVLCPALAGCQEVIRGLCLSQPGDVRSWGPGSGDARGAVSPPGFLPVLESRCPRSTRGVGWLPGPRAACVLTRKHSTSPHQPLPIASARCCRMCQDHAHGTATLHTVPCVACWHLLSPPVTTCHLPSPHPVRTLSQPSLGQRPSP